MTTLNEKPLSKANELEVELQFFMGSDARYRHAQDQNVLYTPGVKHLANRAKAHWLLDSIVSALKSPEFMLAESENPLVGEIHYWELNTNRLDGTAILHAESDYGSEPFIKRNFTLIDFPFDQIGMLAVFDEGDWTLYMPIDY